MRFFIRNKTKYDPSSAFKDAVIAVDVDQTQDIGKIKEEVRKVAKGCKITALYVVRQDGSFIDLADDRTINFYNLQDSMILETTANPFWVTALYSNMKRREQEAALNPEDAKLCFQAQKSIIHRCMAIGLLFNGTGETEKQPPTFHGLDELYEYCYTQGKKPAYMSQFTLDELQEMLDMFKENLQNKVDPIGAFIYSQVLKLGYLQENDGIDGGDPFRSHYHQTAEQQRDDPAARHNGRQNGNAVGGEGAVRRRRANACICDDCEVAMATYYCGDCTPPLRLCDNCWAGLHRGATRRDHQRRDLSEAPRRTSYVPKAYRAPFAMLVAFHRASQERVQKGSLTAEELKARGQPFTDTDLEEAKQRGRPFCGFDSLENTLIKNDIVLKEAARIPKYSLQQSGQGLALKCSNFDYAVQTLVQQAAVPTVPHPAFRRPLLNNREVCLLVDIEEPQKDRFIKVAQQRGVSVKVRKLPTGDFSWILLPPGVQAHDSADIPDQELVLPYLVERKTWSDLWASVRSPRFESQVSRMKSSGIKHLFYLVEGSPKDIAGRPGPEVEKFLQGKLDCLLLQDKFFVNRTASWLKTVEWLCDLTNLAIAHQQTDGARNLVTFSEFTRKANQHTANADRKVAPADIIVWSADQFAENISSHHRNEGDIGTILSPTPQLTQSVLVIQGLTAYNTNCNSLYNRTLADYLQMPGQTAQECVQLHLEDYTSQLISVDVFQYYTLYLEVFKNVRIYRTETQEETKEFVSQFGNGFSTNDRPKQEATRVKADLMFANDSQEEDNMLQQALQQSLSEQQDPPSVEIVGSHKENRPSSSKLYVGTSQGTGGCNMPTEQNREYKETNSVPGSTVNPSPVKQGITEEEDDLQNVLQFKLYDVLQDKLQKESCYSEKSSPTDPDDVELKKALEQSRMLHQLEQRGGNSHDNLPSNLVVNGKDKANKKESKSDSEDEELQRILQESKLQYEKEQRMSRAGDDLLVLKQDSGKDHKTISDSDDELQRALEESRVQYEMDQRVVKLGKELASNGSRRNSQSNHEAHRSKRGSHDMNLVNTLEQSRQDYLVHDLRRKKIMPQDTTAHRQDKNSDFDDELQKALQESQLQLYGMEQKGPCNSSHKFTHPDDEFQKALQESQLQYELDQKRCSGFGENQVKKQTMDVSLSVKENQQGLRKRSLLNGKENTPNNKGRRLRTVLEDSRKEMRIERREHEIMVEQNNNQDDTEREQTTATKNNVKETDQDNAVSIDSQEENGSDGISHDFEIPDFVNQQSDTNNDSHITIAPITSASTPAAPPSGPKTNSTAAGITKPSDRSSTLPDIIKPRITSRDDCTKVLADNTEMIGEGKNNQKCQEDFTTCHATPNSGINNDSIYVDSQDDDDDDDNHYVDDNNDDDDDTVRLTKSWENKNHSSNKVTRRSQPSKDDVILIDSQDDEKDDNTSDYQIAMQLQEELNKETSNWANNSLTNNPCSPSNSKEIVDIQINSYRKERQQRYHKSNTHKCPAKTDPGLAFRQKAEAIAKGKVSLLSRYQGRDKDRRKPEKRGFDGRVKEKTASTDGCSSFSTTHPSSMTARKTCNASPNPFRKSIPPQSESNPSSPNKKARKSCNSSPLVFPSPCPPPSHSGQRQSTASTTSSQNGSVIRFPPSSPSPCFNVTRESSTANSTGRSTLHASSPSSSNSRTTRDDTAHGFVFPSRSSCASPRQLLAAKPSTIQDNQHTGESPKATKLPAHIPKCSDCSEMGHRKGTKRCPYYYTEKAQRKREEQARKRKEKRDEEDREQQTKVDALVAEQAEMAERAEQLRIQIEQFNQHNNNLPRMVEDAMKSLKKKRRK